jgi:hypothetical protein
MPEIALMFTKLLKAARYELRFVDPSRESSTFATLRITGEM